MKSDSVLFGDRQAFAVECRILYETNTPSRNAAGSLWFWIGSQEVGNKHVVSLPGIAANELKQTLRWCGARHDRRLFDADATTVLDIIDRGLYGRSESDLERWQRFLICMLPGGHPYIDGWLVVMIEGPDRATPRRDRVLCRGAALPKDREV
jgi:hypothetical protein